MLNQRTFRGEQVGFGLLELMVGIAIFAIAMALAAPAFADWMRNVRVRSTAESIQSGLYFARAEAVRRNTVVRFQFTTGIDSSCALSASGTSWVVNMSVTDSPEGACGTAISDSTEPYILKVSPIISSSNPATVTADRELIGFESMGRQSSLNSAVSTDTVNIDVKSSTGTCVAAGGSVQCLRVVVSPAGQISMCDPAHTDTTDPLSCPT
jgi:type IV fimbrial biogenesis protein FimT